jgi:DtxR family manganese transport transcriptional regulator
MVGALHSGGVSDRSVSLMPSSKHPSSAAREKAAASVARAEASAAGNTFIHTRSRKQNELAEDYVELIDDLIRSRGEARIVDIAKALGVSHVTVSKAINRLMDAGLVHSEPYRSVFLTDAGKALAEEARERHRIVEDFLVALGVPLKQASLDAEGIEHHVSARTLQAMQKFIKQRR